MAYSESAEKLKKAIEQAMEDQKITRAELDRIMAVATADSHIDAQEQALLYQLQELIDNKSVKVVP